MDADPSESDIRAIVRDELARTMRTVLGKVVWTVASAFAVLVGVQLLQFGVLASSVLATVGFALAGVFVTGSSLYLLYLLHWT